MVTRRTMRFKATISAAEGREYMRLERERLRRELEERARRDACAAHRFVRVEAEPPSWYCPNCSAPAGLDYVRGFVSGLIAAGADPSAFVADYGTWP